MSRRRKAERAERQALNREMRAAARVKVQKKKKPKKENSFFASPARPINKAAFHGPEQTKKRFYKA